MIMDKYIELKSEQDTSDLAAYIAPLLKPGDVLCLYGELGSGKTFFTKQIGKMLFIEDEISSPSFVLLNEYKTGKFPLFHVDLFRLRDEGELLDLGLLDMIESGITVIEWPELAENLLPYKTLSLYFHFDGKKRWVNIIPDKEHEQFFG
jgi:tRNA threonylcarbamoyladenosine biosynthesis protein TsaE